MHICETCKKEFDSRQMLLTWPHRLMVGHLTLNQEIIGSNPFGAIK